MQPGEMIWFLVGIGTGLALAMLGFALMAVVDSRRLGRSPQARPEPSEPAPRRINLPSIDDPLPDVPPEPVPAARRRAGAARLKRSHEPEGSLDEMMSSLAAELERMQSSESTRVTVELPQSMPPMTAVAEPVEVDLPLPPADSATVEPAAPARRADVPLTPMRAAMTKAMEARRAQPREQRRAEPMPPVQAAPPAQTDGADGVAETRHGGAAAPDMVPEVKPAALIRPARPAIAPPGTFAPAIRPAPVAAAPADGAAEMRLEAVDGEAEPAKPKVPPLPRVAPARKFAPALPPRHPPAGKPN